MPSLDMSGPFPFNSAGIDRNVPKGINGNYALVWKDQQDGNYYVAYVGRSSDVNKRLHEHLNCPDEDWSGVPFFKFSSAATELAAYKKECQNYHDFLSKYLRNENHPDKPDGAPNETCPVCRR